MGSFPYLPPLKRGSECTSVKWALFINQVFVCSINLMITFIPQNIHKINNLISKCKVNINPSEHFFFLKNQCGKHKITVANLIVFPRCKYFSLSQSAGRGKGESGNRKKNDKTKWGESTRAAVYESSNKIKTSSKVVLAGSIKGRLNFSNSRWVGVRTVWRIFYWSRLIIWRGVITISGNQSDTYTVYETFYRWRICSAV